VVVVALEDVVADVVAEVIEKYGGMR